MTFEGTTFLMKFMVCSVGMLKTRMRVKPRE